MNQQQQEQYNLPQLFKQKRTRRTKQEVAADKQAKEAAKLEKKRAATKKVKEAELQKGRKQAQRWDLGNMFGQTAVTRAPRRSKVQMMLAKRAKEVAKKEKEQAKKAKDQQTARQAALKNAVKMMKDAQAGAKKPRAPKRSAVQIMLAKQAKEADKKAKEEAKKAKEQQKARQTALKNAAKAMKQAQKAAKAKAKVQKENKKTAKNLKKEIKAAGKK